VGLHLNFELRLPGTASYDDAGRVLRDLRAFALKLPFRDVSRLYAGPRGAEHLKFIASVIADAYPSDDPPRVGDVATARGFFVHPGDRCETASVGLLLRAAHDGTQREWFWHCSCKTQYASLVGDRHLVTCHTGLVRLLDHAIALEVGVIVRDETHYWESRDERRLIREVHRMNQIVAGIAGRVSDAIGPSAAVQAPIFDHRRFEHLEMGEEDEDVGPGGFEP